MNKKILAAVCAAVLLTGCGTKPADPDQASITTVTEPTMVSSMYTEDEDTTDETPQMSSSQLIYLYRKYQSLLGAPSMEEMGCTYEDLLLQMDAAYEEELTSMKRLYGEVKYDCGTTALTNFMTESGSVHASEYDPMTAVLYAHCNDMDVNPIELVRKMNDAEELEWHEFDHTYKIRNVNAPSGVSEREYLKSVLSNYSQIHKDSLRIGYSAEEELYYCYFVNLNPEQNQYKHTNLTVCALYFQFDDATGKLVRCGAETYVRSTDSLRLAAYAAYGYPDSHIGYRDYFSAWKSAGDRYYHDFLPDQETISAMMEDTLLPREHESYSEFVLGLLTGGNANTAYETSNLAKFSMSEDFHSAMNVCYHFNAGHFVTWFELT